MNAAQERETLKDAAKPLFEAWLTEAHSRILNAREKDLIKEAFLAGLNMALEARVHYLLDMPIIATNIIKEGNILFVLPKKIWRRFFWDLKYD